MTHRKISFPPVAEQMSVIQRGVVDLLPLQELESKLKRSYEIDKPLIIKCGFDPTAPDLHLGHTVLLQKMRQFQKAGHDVVFLIGDFTGMIGDPSGRSQQRKILTKEEVKANALTYEKQVFKILDPEKTRIEFNSRWMEQMSAAQLIELATHYTVARMLERDDFQKRFKSETPISIREFLYPIVQGYDSVALKSDIELGGTDQKFNLLVAREIQRSYGQEMQVVLTMPLLEGLDGVQKMSKSLGNYVGITEPPKEMFGKLMSINDDIMLKYFELLTDISNEDLLELKEDLKTGKAHPRDTKARLAREIVARYHGEAAGKQAEKEFDRQFRDKEAPQDRLLIKPPSNKKVRDISPGMNVLPILSQLTWAGYLFSQLPSEVKSTSNAKRLISQKAIKHFPKGDLSKGITITDPKETVKVEVGDLIKVGKRIWAEVRQ